MPFRRVLVSIRSLFRSVQNAGERPVVRSLAGLLSFTLISQLCSFGILLVAAPQLGAERLGVFLFALIIQNSLMQLGGLQAGQPLVRELTAHRERTDEFVSSYLLLITTATVVVTAAAFNVVVAAGPESEERAMWTWILIGNVASSLNLLPIYDAHHRQARAGLVAAVVDVLILMLFLLTAQSGSLTLVTAGQLMAAKWGLIFAGQLILLQPSIRRLNWLIRLPTIRLFFSSGVQVLFAFLLLLLPLYGGVILMRFLRSEEETAIFGIASQMATAHLLFCLQAARIAQPHITGPHGTERWFVRKLVLGYGGISTALTLGAAVVGSAVILWFLAPLYRQSLLPLMILLLGSQLLAVGYVEGLYLHRFRQETGLLLCYGLGGAVYLLLAWWLIPGWGPIGASLAVIGAAGVSAGLMALRLVKSGRNGTA